MQAIMNFRRKSTIGFSIGNILLDLLGGLTNYGQMAVQSIDQSEFVFFLSIWSLLCCENRQLAP